VSSELLKILVATAGVLVVAAALLRVKIVRGRADKTMLVWTQGAVLESTAPTKSAKSTESADGGSGQTG